VFDEDEIEAFFSISNRVKFERVIAVLIEDFVEHFNYVTNLKKRPDKNEVMTALQSYYDFEDFIELLFDDLFVSFIEKMGILTDADCNPYDLIDSLNEEDTKIIFQAQAVIGMCCSSFFTVFGQYLQLIMPESNNPFSFSSSDDEFLNALKHEDENNLSPVDKSSIGAMFYHVPPGLHYPSALGYSWFNLSQLLNDNDSSPFIPANEYQDILNLMLLSAEDDADSVVDSYLRKLLADPEKADSVIDALSDILSDGLFSNNDFNEPDISTANAVYHDEKDVKQNIKTTGNCYMCGVELSKIAMKNHLLKVHGAEKDGQKCSLIKLEGAYDKDYWLFIDIPADKRLSEIDAFLRKIWLECCGHLSQFRSAKRSHYDEISKNRKLSAFSTGDKFIHEYDFGSTTETLITIVGATVRKPQKATVRLLARNVAPEFSCAKCGSSAKFICTECMYDHKNPFYCKKCGKKHIHDDMLLPVTNSPRFGVCGYEGERDTFGYDPKGVRDGEKL